MKRAKRHVASRLGLLMVVAVLAAVVAGITASPAAAHGCTPGFWKNHPELYVSNPQVSSVFTGFDSSIGSLTISGALSLGGGPGLLGAEKILARAAAGAYFNITVTGDYPITLATLVSEVNAALASADRDTILALATELDSFNNLGNATFCP